MGTSVLHINVLLSIQMQTRDGILSQQRKMLQVVVLSCKDVCKESCKYEIGWSVRSLLMLRKLFFQAVNPALRGGSHFLMVGEVICLHYVELLAAKSFLVDKHVQFLSRGAWS